jgi:hypothetical protein
MKRVYISGRIGDMDGNPLSDVDFFIVKEKFNKKQRELESMGFKAINPAINPKNKGRRAFECMKNNIRLLLDCDAITFTTDARYSHSCWLELEIAKKCNIELIDTNC